MPTPVLSNKTPFEILFHQVPNYKRLKTFGCLCYPWLRPHSTSKLQPKSSQCLFLGYSTAKSAYQCLDYSSNRTRLVMLFLLRQSFHYDLPHTLLQINLSFLYLPQLLNLLHLITPNLSSNLQQPHLSYVHLPMTPIRHSQHPRRPSHRL